MDLRWAAINSLLYMTCYKHYRECFDVILHLASRLAWGRNYSYRHIEVPCEFDRDGTS